MWAAGAASVLLPGLAFAAFTLIGLAIDDPATQAAVEKHTIMRPLSPVSFQGSDTITEWLLNHPVAAATLARHLYPPLEKYQVTERSDGRFEVNDLASLRGHFREVARGPNRRVFYCHGQFRSLSYIMSLSGGMVFTLEHRGLSTGPDARAEVAPVLYLRLDNVVAHGTLKLLAPLIHGIIDRRVANLAAATQAVGERIAKDPVGLYQEMQTWPDARRIDVEAFRRAFAPQETGE